MFFENWYPADSFFKSDVTATLLLTIVCVFGIYKMVLLLTAFWGLR